MIRLRHGSGLSCPAGAEAHIPSLLSKARLSSIWNRLRISFWFLPSAMAGAAVALSFILIRVDTWLGAETVNSFIWLYTFGPEGARAILSAVASSMITVAGLTFSMTMLTLQLASSQFGPRLLRNFMRDRGNQIVLGTFTSTFIYCLLVLRTIRGVEGASFVPHLAVAFGVLLALASIAVLIYFIHHIATAIRIETLLAALADETHAAVDRLYPERLGHGPPPVKALSENLIPNGFDRETRSIRSGSGGYIQQIDVDALLRLATKHDLIVRIDARPGRFVRDCDVIYRAFPSERVPDELADRLRATFAIGQERTPDQDLEFSIRRIVEIAQRALSPGINDPTTALYCIDRIGETMGRLAARQMPGAWRFDDADRLRVITDLVSLDEIACPAFAAVARYGLEDVDVVAHLVRTLNKLVGIAGGDSCTSLISLAADIRRRAEEQFDLEFDREKLGAADTPEVTFSLPE